MEKLYPFVLEFLGGRQLGVFNRLVSFSGDALPVFLGAAVKGIFQIAVASAIYSWAEAQTASRVFQYLFFQSACISLLSASGYFRGYSVSDDAVELSRAIFQHIVLCCVFIVAVLMYVSVFFSSLPDLGYFGLLSIGAVFVSLAAPLQGAIVRLRSFKAAFIPQAICGLLGVVALLVSPFQTVFAVLSYVLIVQVLIFCIYVYQIESVDFDSFRKAISFRFWPGFLNYVGVGIVNFSGLFIVFLVREYWVSGVDPEVAAAVFMVLRFSDSILGVGTQILVRFSALINLVGVPKSLGFFSACFFLVLTTTLIMYIGLFFSLVMSAVLVQIFVEFWRYPAAILFVERAKRFSVLPFAVFNIVPHTFVLAAVLAFGVFHLEYGMQLYLSLVAALSCLIAFLGGMFRRIFPVT